MSRLSRLRGPHERGQATIETVAAIPVVVAVTLAIIHVLAAGAASEVAGAAAHAGAAAMLQGADPAEAARRVLGDHRGVIRVRGRRVSVTVVPGGPVRPLARRLVARSTADAGHGVPVAAPQTVRGGDGAGSRPAAGGPR